MFSWIWDSFAAWLKSLLIDSVKSAMSSMYGYLDSTVNGLSGTLGQTPKEWNGNIFSFVQNLSQTVINPVAGIILGLVASYELIALIAEKNNMRDFDLWMLYKWAFKTALSVELVTHTFDIVLAVFDLGKYLVQKTQGVVSTSVATNFSSTWNQLAPSLNNMTLGALLGIFLEAQLIWLSVLILQIACMLVIYARMIEIYLYSSIGPVPMATLFNHEWGDIGKNYLKSLFALGFQAFFMLVCIGIYAVLVQSAAQQTDVQWKMLSCLGYSALLCFSLFKTGSLSKSIFNAH